jgi:hypothetical protein
MSRITIKLMLPSRSRDFFFQDDKIAYAREALKERAYIICAPFVTDEEGANAAEEAFDLTNNPSRQEERERIYGRGRSVSSGDIVDVDGTQYLCLSVGWTIIP